MKGEDELISSFRQSNMTSIIKFFIQPQKSKKIEHKKICNEGTINNKYLCLDPIRVMRVRGVL